MGQGSRNGLVGGRVFGSGPPSQVLALLSHMETQADGGIHPLASGGLKALASFWLSAGDFLSSKRLSLASRSFPCHVDFFSVAASKDDLEPEPARALTNVM